jgi:hypothetical protein
LRLNTGTLTAKDAKRAAKGAKAVSFKQVLSLTHIITHLARTRLGAAEVTAGRKIIAGPCE